MPRKTLSLTPTAVDAAQAAALLAKEVYMQLIANGFRDLSNSESGRAAVSQMSATLAASIITGNLKTKGSDFGVADIAF